MSNKQKTEKMWAELAPYYDVWYQWKDYCLESQHIHELIKKNIRNQQVINFSM